MKLTSKQESYAMGLFAGKSQIDSHRFAYPNKMTDKVRIEAASRLAKNSKVVARLKELRVPVVKKALMTLEGHLISLEKLRDKAVKVDQFGPAVSAEVARGKASGVHVEQTKQELSGPGGTPLVPPKLTVIIGANPNASR